MNSYGFIYQNYFQLSAIRILAGPFLSCHLLYLFLSEVAKLDAPLASHTAEGGRLYVPVFNGVGEQTDARVQVLLHTGHNGTEVVDSHIADFVAVKENHLCRQRECAFKSLFMCFLCAAVSVLPFRNSMR